MTSAARLITLTVLAAAAGCDATTGPSQLDRARVLAVQIAPPHLGPEQTALVLVLVGHSDGTVSEVEPQSIAVVGAPPGSPASGMVGRGADGWAVACPDSAALEQLRVQLEIAPGEPIPIPLALEVEVDGEILTATKNVYLGSQGDNPALAGISAAGAVDDGGVLVAEVGVEIAIAAEGTEGEGEGEGEGELSYAWFTSVGEIDLYLSAEATLVADEPGEGQVALVVRDDRGGVTWTWRDLRVE